MRALYLFLICALSASILEASEIKTETSIVLDELFSNSDDIVGVDLHVAGGYEDGPFYSRWGHAFMVFVNKNEKRYYNNVAISLVANINEEQESLGFLGPLSLYYKGMVGSYPLVVDADYFYYFWQRHVLNEGRPLERISIGLNDVIKDKLLSMLKEYFHDPSKMGSYKFVGNNCVVALSHLLKEAGVPLDDVPVIPLNAKESYSEAGVVSVPTEMVVSPVLNTQKIAQAFSELNITTYEQVNMKLLKELAEKFGADSVYAFLSLDRGLSIYYGDEFKAMFEDELAKNAMKKSFEAHPSLYSLCEDLSCAKNIITAEKKYYGQNTYAKNAFRRHALANSVEGDNIYIRHNQILVEAGKPEARSVELEDVPVASSQKVRFKIQDYIEDESVLVLKAFGQRNYPRKRQFVYLRKVQMQKRGESLYFQGKKCVDLKKNEFHGNCGIIKEERIFKLYAY